MCLHLQAIAPDKTSFYGIRDLPNGRASNWSHRHAAYAAGLGTFGLSDGKEFPKVVDDRASMTTGDKAYDSKKNHRLLSRKRICSAISIKNNRRSRRLKKHQMKPEVIAAQRERPKTERKFTELKRYQGLGHARYCGLVKLLFPRTRVQYAQN